MKTTNYRVNFGNGQIQDVASKAEGLRIWKESNDTRVFLQKYEAGSADDPGCWVRARTTAKECA